jgi:hypothetical protein
MLQAFAEVLAGRIDEGLAVTRLRESAVGEILAAWVSTRSRASA